LAETPKILETKKPVANKHTTIRITTELQKILIDAGRKGMSYDEIIREQLNKGKSHGQ
jgi:predicted DNA binding CopG/RHH family protein